MLRNNEELILNYVGLSPSLFVCRVFDVPWHRQGSSKESGVCQ